ncbi:MAG: type II toxin-antitoxin system RelE/ParE family toxin [Limisphaerales bacterium]
MKIRLLTSAFNDMADGRDFYERQAQGLGEYFLNSLFSDIDSLALYAGVHRKVFGFHRLLSKRFPYAIYYQIETVNTVVVYRVLDCRQNPRKIRTSLKADD